MEPEKLLVTEVIKYTQTQPVIAQNARNQRYFNPVAMSDFDSTVVNPTLYVGFEPLSNQEVIIHHNAEKIPGAVRLRRPKNKRTGSCSFGPVLAGNPT